MQGEICPMKPRQDVRDAMDAFRSAAARRGAYAEQCEAAEAALQLLEPADTLLLEELQDSLQRLLTTSPALSRGAAWTPGALIRSCRSA